MTKRKSRKVEHCICYATDDGCCSVCGLPCPVHAPQSQRAEAVVYGVRYCDSTGLYISQPDYWGFFQSEAGAKDGIKVLQRKHPNHLKDSWEVDKIEVRP